MLEKVENIKGAERTKSLSTFIELSTFDEKRNNF